MAARRRALANVKSKQGCPCVSRSKRRFVLQSPGCGTTNMCRNSNAGLYVWQNGNSQSNPTSQSSPDGRPPSECKKM